MWTIVKNIPAVLKVAIVFLLVVLVVVAARPRRHFSTEPFESAQVSYQGHAGSGGSGQPQAQSQALAQYQAQQAQLVGRMRQCQVQMNQATQQMAQAAVNGIMVDNRPACEQYMPQWISQEAYLETEIYRIQTGDNHSTVREITGITGPDTSTRSSGRSSNDGSGAVDRYDREAIRGNSIYVDESGEEHELPTRNYYFRDRSSGRIVGSDSPYAPNDGRDYEQLTYRP